MTGKFDPNPLPAPPPVPPRTLLDAVKILLAVVVWYAMTGASTLLSAGIEHHNSLTLTSGVIGCILALYLAKGLAVGIKALDFFWAGPSFFEALSPVITTASRIGSNFVSDFRRAWNSRSDDGSNDGSNGAVPVPAPLPAPPTVDLKTIADVVRVLVALVVWYLMTGASEILGKIIETHSQAPLTFSVVTCVMGLYVLQGIVLGIKALDFFWAGPSFFEALAPVMALASRLGSNFVAAFTRAWRTSRGDDSDDTGSGKSGKGAGDGAPAK
jgi:hypothetical protein